MAAQPLSKSGPGATGGRTRLVLLLLALLSPLWPGAAGATEVLVLHSYHPGYRWTDDLQRGIDAVLKGRPGTRLNIQYLDTKRYADPNYLALQRALLERKFAAHPPDLILSSDDNAFDFLLANRDRLFPGVPWVFCGVNYLDPKRLAGQTGVTGVNEEPDIALGLDQALALHPAAKRLLVVTDTTTTGRHTRPAIDAALKALPAGLAAEVVDDIGIAELVDKVEQLPPDSLIFYTLFIRDNRGRFFKYDEALAQLLEHTRVPVYITWDFNLGQGVVGGLLTSGFAQGQAAARMAEQILDGTDPDRIPLRMRSPNRYRYDYAALTRFRLSPADLPAGSQVINEPDSFYQRYKAQLWYLTLVMLFLCALILIQRLHIQRQKAIQLALKESKQTLQGIFDHSFHFIALLGTDGTLLKANRTATDFAGISEHQVLGMAVWNTPWWKHSLEQQQRLQQAIHLAAHGQPDRFQATFQDPLGTEMIMDFSLQSLIDEGGRPALLIAEGRDITRLKAAESQLQRLNEELELRIQQRTRDLQQTNGELSETLTRLRGAQTRLVESEKLASLGNLVAGVAHEINTPLGIGVTAASHLRTTLAQLFDKYGDNRMTRTDFEHAREELEESATLLEANLERAAELVGSFKLVAADRASEERRRFALRPYLEDILTTLKPELSRHPHRIELHCPDDLSLDSYPGLFSQLLTNLILNSLQHGYEAGQQGRIRIDAGIEDGWLALGYRDDGRGVAPEQLEQLFDPFYTTRRGSGNTGLGTSIIYNIVTGALGGEISCQSPPGQGLGYRIRIPLRPADELTR